MRILFVSDTHLGIDLPARPRVTRRRRGEDFFRNFERALAPALAGNVDVVLHGGDLHSRSRVPAWLAEAALAPLKKVASAGVPVLLVPGNHERARLPYPLLALHENLYVFDRPRSVILEARGLRVAFAGFPYARAVRAGFSSLLAATGYRMAPADIRVLCLHHCVEGATCGPGTFTFTTGDDVIRAAELPRDVAVVLSGHIHRHQVLATPDRPSVVYAGSVERTSFAEADETKGAVVIEVSREGLESLEFRPLPTRPMVVRRLSLAGLGTGDVRARLAYVVESTPPDAIVRVQVDEAPGPGRAPWLTAAELRELAGERTLVLVGQRPPGRRDVGRPGGRARAELVAEHELKG